ncbi:hypothetical protein SLEP1_g27583 [Rubroshorea leprosula]|uniref:Integrase catalytic domain-containing protein n=1 Tax=Rubroshorea leprosula TaxID=152421 RepID=A0AAV5K280_9ROSI|nr:hypothetical protein SLEP1_g27583 [Rubroshorea leprosula]
MADEANLEKVALENRVENMENTLKELMASFQTLQATLVTRAPLTTNPLFEGNVPVANLSVATFALTLGVISPNFLRYLRSRVLLIFFLPTPLHPDKPHPSCRPPSLEENWQKLKYFTCFLVQEQELGPRSLLKQENFRSCNLPPPLLSVSAWCGSEFLTLEPARLDLACHNSLVVIPDTWGAGGVTSLTARHYFGLRSFGVRQLVSHELSRFRALCICGTCSRVHGVCFALGFGFWGVTLGKEPMSSGPPDPIIGGTSGTKPFVLNAGVATVQSNGQEEIQDSLTGPADTWFSTIDKSKVKSWHDLTYNFMKQYEYNTLLALSREDLQRIEKESSESFKEFAQRWCGLAARVQLPLTDHELKQMEDGIKSGIIIDYQAMKSLLKQYQNGSSGVSSSRKVGQNQKKENDTSTVSSVYEMYGRNNQPCPRGQFNNSFQAPIYQPPIFTSQPRPLYASGINCPQQERVRRHFNKLPLSYTEVFRQLVAAGLVTPVPMMPVKSPFPTWYNPQARCEYHSGGVGHDLENCLALRHRVQDLIDAKELKIASEPEVVGPNIAKNPLPTHDGPTINMIIKDLNVEKDSHRGHKEFPVEDIALMTRSGHSYGESQCKGNESQKGIIIEEIHEEQVKKYVSEQGINDLLSILKRKTHQNALLKILNEAHVAKDIDMEKFNNVIGTMLAPNFINFTDDEMLEDGRGHVKALHISVFCKDMHVPRVLIDNVVYAFDGTRKEVDGEIELPVNIGPYTFDLTFQVMNIELAFNMLLGRPWIHMAGAVPSTLHQKLKYIVGNSLVMVNGEKDYAIHKATSVPYVEVDSQNQEATYHSMEFVSTIYVAEGTVLRTPDLSRVSKGVAKVMLENHFEVGKGLGIGLQGIEEPIEVIDTSMGFGLGYKPTRKDWLWMRTRKAKRRRAKLEGREPNEEQLHIPHIRVKFPKLVEVVCGYDTKPMDETLKKENLRIDWVPIAYKDEVIVEDALDDEDMGTFDLFKSFASTNDDGLNTSLEKLSICVIDKERDDDKVILPTQEEELKLQPNLSEVETVNLGTNEDKKEIKINGQLHLDKRKALVDLLKEFQDVFAWSYEDMPGLGSKIVVHAIPLRPKCPLVKQKLRRMKPKMLLKIKEEVKKLLDAGFIKVAMYPQWVANIVSVPKKDGKVRMCVNYRDLNKASPKDDFPLPHIQLLVDNAAKSVKFSFVDGYFGYNQIKIKEVDKIKTMFITLWGTFCYKCQEAFDKIKQYLKSPPILVPPMDGRPLILYITVLEVKGQVIADHLAENAVEDYQPVDWEFLDEDIMAIEESNYETSNWKMYFDGAANQNGNALATLASMVQISNEDQIQPLMIDVHKNFAYCMEIEQEIDGQPWYYDIKQYILHNQYPIHATNIDKKTIRRMAKSYFLNGDTLYKRSADMTLLRCVDAIEAKRIMVEVHEGICGTHANGHMLPRKILRAGYFWLKIETDCIDYVRKCHKCQIYADRIKGPPFPLHNMVAPWPFSMWGIDVIGPINPKASNGHQFILVAIDYFSKWVEVAAYTNVKNKVVARFIQREIICRYGQLETIITDNAKNLNNSLMASICKQHKIQHLNSTPYRPKMNEAVEAANKNIKKILAKMTVTYKDWH